MTHATTGDQRRTPDAAEQYARERVYDRDWTVIEALHETGAVAGVLSWILVTAALLYGGGQMAHSGQPVFGIAAAVGALLVGGWMLDRLLCIDSPAAVHECARCRRATDRWRGPTLRRQWFFRVLGQPSPAADTPTADRYDLAPAERPPEPRDPDGEAIPAVRYRPQPRSPPDGLIDEDEDSVVVELAKEVTSQEADQE